MTWMWKQGAQEAWAPLSPQGECVVSVAGEAEGPSACAGAEAPPTRKAPGIWGKGAGVGETDLLAPQAAGPGVLSTSHAASTR